ncbi:MAG: enoyl-CoA hydratase/isomerase family protein [Gammaproteobacteria bacterium]|nr:enoyl-CoA hydratase/isomerase family protein [Gammaproteobacteria bacterium]
MAVVRYSADGDIAVVTIHHPPANALTQAVRSGLREALARASGEGIAAIVIIGEGGNFSTGAELSDSGTAGLDEEPRLPGLLQAIEAGSKPVVAAIRGAALGGGLELALACHWRVAGPDATLGLPEIRLGLIPGAGATRRLPRLAGPEIALEICTSGRTFDVDFALRHGLVEEMTAGDLLLFAKNFARRMIREDRPVRRSGCLTERIENLDPGVFDAFRKKIGRRARGQIAPWRCIDAVEAGCKAPREQGERLEREAFEECVRSPQHRALSYQFRAEREARRIPGIPGDLPPLPVRSAAVVGAGTMGGGIAMCFAGAGIPVKLIEQSDEALQRGMGMIEKNYAGSVSRGSLTRAAAGEAMARITPAVHYDCASEADIVIEAVYEDLELKKSVFRRLDAVAAPHAILASNTSSLNIDELAAVTARPEKFVGTHFFSPANVMRLLETVRGARTSPQTIVTVMSLAGVIGKIPVLAGNCDGFIGNRMLQFYTGGAEYLLEEGATPEQIDRVMEDFGMPMGPLAMRDLAGNDVGLMIRKARAGSLPKEERLSPILDRIVEQGRLGQKTGRGFYRYDGRTRIADPEVMHLVTQVSRELGIRRREIDDQEILARLLHPLVNEGARILAEGIAIRPGDIDVVFVNGYGFPAYRGGPMYWSETTGLDRIRETMVRLGERFGPRWRPAALLERRIREGRGWSAA